MYIICMYVCIYIYIYIYIHIFIFIFIYFPLHTQDYLTKFNYVSVATDKGPSPKLALREDRSRGNIES